MPTGEHHANKLGNQNANNSCNKCNKTQFKEVNIMCRTSWSVPISTIKRTVRGTPIIFHILWRHCHMCPFKVIPVHGNALLPSCHQNCKDLLIEIIWLRVQQAIASLSKLRLSNLLPRRSSFNFGNRAKSQGAKSSE